MNKQIIISDYFTATLTLPEKIVEYQLKPCKDNQLVDKINEQNSYLERKEQECEELKAKCKKYGEINEQETKDYAELKAENDELKELIAQDQCFQDKSHKCVKSFYIDERYKQSIEKIKEIAYELTNEEYTDFIEDKQKQILQKISEVQDVSSDS